MLSKEFFIEVPAVFDPEYRTEDPLPVFRKIFSIEKIPAKATLAVCAPGFGEYYLNGKKVTEDKFISPVSDYNKTLWYNEYDVTGLLCKGKNVFAAILGNGFYNESLHTAWDFNKADWRGLPKMTVCLEADSEILLSSDETFRCSLDSGIRFSELRSGETADLRFPSDWMMPGFDDSGWLYARRAVPPKGILRRCDCQPIRECEILPAKEVFFNADGHPVIDFGQNISGYIRLKVKPGTGKIVIRYTEMIDTDGRRDLGGMDQPPYYVGCEFMTDTVIAGNTGREWSPRFVYHGFRYVILEGDTELTDPKDAKAVFVHQDVETLTSFSCSDEMLNRLFRMGTVSTLSNLFYSVTDCPTREKLGWCNDARASAGQMLLNFDSLPLFRKWYTDILDSMREDGSMPGIVPTCGWGYADYSGPIANAVLFDIPYLIYRYFDDPDLLISALPYFEKYISYAESKKDNSDGLIGFGLCDWAGPFEGFGRAPTPLKLSDSLLLLHFCRVAALAAGIAGAKEQKKRFENSEKALFSAVRAEYYDPASGTCRIGEQTAVSMMICEGIYDDLRPMADQLHRLIADRDYHLHAGMLGMQYLYPALDLCGLNDDAYRIITAKGRPSYNEWIDHDATTMWEMWNTTASKNHHMHSCVLSWITESLVGLRLNEKENGFVSPVIKPYFRKDMEYCHASLRTKSGSFTIDRRRKGEDFVLELEIPENITAKLILDGYETENGEKELDVSGKISVVCRREKCPVIAARGTTKKSERKSGERLSQ